MKALFKFLDWLAMRIYCAVTGHLFFYGGQFQPRCGFCGKKAKHDLPT